ncbi:OmpA family protein [Rhodopila sp.]|uniref:OmpA family protein n=1 Tax=Rhodopila sp. TaxID=2480087 RepID=UPI003D0FC306
MRYRFAMCLLIVTIGGCASLFGTNKQKFSIFFQPYSVDLDQQARQTVDTAAAFAKDHPSQPVELIGFAAPPDPGQDVAGLSAQRAEVVKQALVSIGVRPDRITVTANGITDPENLPNLSVRRVDISVGP